MKNYLLLDDETAIKTIEDLADGDFEYLNQEIFFFGELYNDGPLEEQIEDGATYTICPCCAELFKLQDGAAETGNTIHCPHCGTEGTLFAYRDKELPMDQMGYSRSAHFEEVEGGYVLRIFEWAFDFSNREYDNYYTITTFPNLWVEEQYREYLINGKVEYYQRKNDVWNPIDVRSLDETDIYYCDFNEDSGYLEDITGEYESFIEALRQNSPLKAQKTFLKYGFTQLAEECICTSHPPFPDENKISLLLDGVDYNHLIKEYKPEDVTIHLLNLYKEVKALGLVPSKANIDIYYSLNKENYTKTNLKKTFKYLRHVAAGNYSGIAKDYNDYIENCKKLNKDVNAPEIRYPSDFKKAHNEAYEQVLMIQDKSKAKKFAKAIEKYFTLDNYEDKDLLITLAKTIGALRREGNELHHCVGTYADRIAQGTCMIFFVRKKNAPDTSYYTLELNTSNYNIVQCRGDHNKDYKEDPSLAQAIADWQRWVKKKMHKAA